MAPLRSSRADSGQIRRLQNRHGCSTAAPERLRGWPHVCLGLLGLTLWFGIVQADGGTLLEWNYCLLIVGLAGFTWLAIAADSASFQGRALRWAVVLAPSYVALQLLPLPLFFVNLVSPAKAHAVSN